MKLNNRKVVLIGLAVFIVFVAASFAFELLPSANNYPVPSYSPSTFTHTATFSPSPGASSSPHPSPTASYDLTVQTMRGNGAGSSPEAGIAVTITDSATGLTRSAYSSGSDGQATFSGLPYRSSWQVTAKRCGYIMSSSSATMSGNTKVTLTSTIPQPEVQLTVTPNQGVSPLTVTLKAHVVKTGIEQFTDCDLPEGNKYKNVVKILNIQPGTWDDLGNATPPTVVNDQNDLTLTTTYKYFGNDSSFLYSDIAAAAVNAVGGTGSVNQSLTVNKPSSESSVPPVNPPSGSGALVVHALRSGLPEGNVSVTITSTTGQSLTAITRTTDGEADFAGLPNGSWQVTGDRCGENVAATSATVNNNTQSVNLAVTPMAPSVAITLDKNAGTEPLSVTAKLIKDKTHTGFENLTCNLPEGNDKKTVFKTVTFLSGDGDVTGNMAPPTVLTNVGIDKLDSVIFNHIYTAKGQAQRQYTLSVVVENWLGVQASSSNQTITVQSLSTTGGSPHTLTVQTYRGRGNGSSPEAGIAVTLHGRTTGASVNGTTGGSDGHVTFANLAPDIYDVTASRCGYIMDSDTVTMATLDMKSTLYSTLPQPTVALDITPATTGANPFKVTLSARVLTTGLEKGFENCSLPEGDKYKTTAKALTIEPDNWDASGKAFPDVTVNDQNSVSVPETYVYYGTDPTFDYHLISATVQNGIGTQGVSGNKIVSVEKPGLSNVPPPTTTTTHTSTCPNPNKCPKTTTTKKVATKVAPKSGTGSTTIAQSTATPLPEESPFTIESPEVVATPTAIAANSSWICSTIPALCFLTDIPWWFYLILLLLLVLLVAFLVNKQRKAIEEGDTTEEAQETPPQDTPPAVDAAPSLTEADQPSDSGESPSPPTP